MACACCDKLRAERDELKRELAKVADCNDRLGKILGCFGDTLDDLIFWSFRYFVGRKTIATTCFARGLAKAWQYLDPRVRDMISKELEAEFERDDRVRSVSVTRSRPSTEYPLGHDCDRQAWERVREAYSTDCRNCGRPRHNCLCTHEEL